MQEGNPDLREPESFVMGGKQAFLWREMVYLQSSHCPDLFEKAVQDAGQLVLLL